MSRMCQGLQQPILFGINDWAFKKGINYGTAIIDLEQYRVIDLLRDREAQTVENWFKNMPEVTIVTRDRFSRYATEVANGSLYRM